MYKVKQNGSIVVFVVFQITKRGVREGDPSPKLEKIKIDIKFGVKN